MSNVNWLGHVTLVTVHLRDPHYMQSHPIGMIACNWQSVASAWRH